MTDQPKTEKAREWYLVSEKGGCWLAMRGHSESQAAINVIAYEDYEALKAKYEELLSYIPKVPTEPYEKQMAREIEALKAERDELLKKGKGNVFVHRHHYDQAMQQAAEFRAALEEINKLGLYNCDTDGLGFECEAWIFTKQVLDRYPSEEGE